MEIIIIQDDIAERASGQTRQTPYTSVLIVFNSSRFFNFIHGSEQAGADACCFIALQANERNKTFFPRFPNIYPWFCRLEFCPSLVRESAGEFACSAPNTMFRGYRHRFSGLFIE